MSLFRKIAALILCLAMLFSLAACGKDSGDTGDPGKPNTPDSSEHPEFVYTAEFKPLSVSTDRVIRMHSGSEDGVYVSWTEKTGVDVPPGATAEYEGQYDVYEARIGFMDYEGKITKLEGYQPMPRIENTEGRKEFYSYSNLDGVFPLTDGRILTVESRNCNWSEAPEGMDQNSAEYWSYYNYYRDYYIRVLSADGSELSTNQINIGEDEYLNTYCCTVDAEGNLIASQNQSLVAVAADGSIAFKIDGGDDMYIDRIITLKDGTIAVSAWGENGVGLLPVDLESRKFGEAMPLPRAAYTPYPGSGEYDLFYNSGINLYGYNLTTGESTKLLNWMDCDIDCTTMNGLAFAGDGRILALINHWKNNRYSDDEAGNSCEAAIVSRVPYESVPQKTVLTLATDYMNGTSVGEAVVRFNRESSKYRISVKDYSEYNTEEDSTVGLTRLTTEIISGNLPDLLLLNSSMPYEQYAAKGILEDLYPFIDADSELSREDLFPTVLDALEVDGRLCQAASGFGIQCVMGAKSVVGDTPGWNFDQYNAALASMPEGCIGFNQYTIRDNILNTLLAVDSGYYVNWATGECRFESPEFVNLLNFAAAFPENYPDEQAWVDERSLSSEGKQMLVSVYIGGFEDLSYNATCFGIDNTTYIGYPTNEGTGNLFNMGSGIAITKNCADKDGAWQFVRGFLTEEGQEKMQSYCLPTNIKLFDCYLAHEMTPDYEKDAQGNYRLDENGERIPKVSMRLNMPDGSVYEQYAVTQAQADQLRALINSTTKLASYNDSIFKIVSEQAQAFFAGQKSAEEVARLIQSKANIYVNEQR